MDIFKVIQNNYEHTRMHVFMQYVMSFEYLQDMCAGLNNLYNAQSISVKYYHYPIG